MIFYEQTVIDVLDVGVFLKCQKCGTGVHSHVMPKLYCLHIFFLPVRWWLLFSVAVTVVNSYCSWQVV